MGQSSNARRWVFTWNSNSEGAIPDVSALIGSLNEVCREGVFQLESGDETQRNHYQGRFVCKDGRKSKKFLLKHFSQIFDTTQLTLDHELAFDSSSYCTKSETRVAGPFFVGAKSYVLTKTGFKLPKLRPWQQQFLDILLDPKVFAYLRDRKVISFSNPLVKL